MLDFFYRHQAYTTFTYKHLSCYLFCLIFSKVKCWIYYFIHFNISFAIKENFECSSLLIFVSFSITVDIERNFTKCFACIRFSGVFNNRFFIEATIYSLDFNKNFNSHFKWWQNAKSPSCLALILNVTFYSWTVTSKMITEKSCREKSRKIKMTLSSCHTVFISFPTLSNYQSKINTSPNFTILKIVINWNVNKKLKKKLWESSRALLFHLTVAMKWNSENMRLANCIN